MLSPCLIMHKSVFGQLSGFCREVNFPQCMQELHEFIRYHDSEEDLFNVWKG